MILSLDFFERSAGVRDERVWASDKLNHKKRGPGDHVGKWVLVRDVYPDILVCFVGGHKTTGKVIPPVDVADRKIHVNKLGGVGVIGFVHEMEREKMT